MICHFTPDLKCLFFNTKFPFVLGSISKLCSVPFSTPEPEQELFKLLHLYSIFCCLAGLVSIVFLLHDNLCLLLSTFRDF